MSNVISGTKEWSVASVNCLRGCSHDCRYCYAREQALRFGQVRSAADWAKPVVNPAALRKRYKRESGRVMFPTTHDILPEFLDPCMAVLRRLLEVGNEVLIVSKPHVACVKAICDEFQAWRPQILFRFTVGARRDELLSLWEPNAPTYAERLACLQLAHGAGWATSVSAEPLLDAWDARGLFDELAPWITDTFWIGTMNQVRRRVAPGTPPEAIAAIEAGQTRTAIDAVFRSLVLEPKVRWKESYKQVLGLPLVNTAGLDL